jgi:glycosyltransferase involved in cell wall biosynthesis
MTESASNRGTPERAGAVPDLELSVVIPCLNEADTLATCIEKAWRGMREAGVQGEVIVADNGSEDGSPEIAARCGARVVAVRARGYGNALMGGIAVARGRSVLMGDADDSYDFLELPRFVEKLREGFDLVQGCRRRSGGGTIKPGAMPFLHRWLGNPLLTWMVRSMFGAQIHDAYCGLRAFTRDCYRRLGLRCTGMEFATEMIVKAALYDVRLAEVAVTLHPDGRRAHAPHLRTFRDGWRTVRFFLMYSPRWLFLWPGGLLIGFGLLAAAVALPGMTLFGVTFDAHTLLVGSLSILLGYQSVLFALFTRTFAVTEGLMPPDPRLSRFFELVYLERGLLLGFGALAIGLMFILGAMRHWAVLDFGALDYARTLRWVIPGVTLAALGFQTVLSSFFVSILGMGRTNDPQVPAQPQDAFRESHS